MTTDNTPEQTDMSEKTIKTTKTSFDIIEAVAELERPTVSKIADEVDHSLSTVHYHLKTLQQERYVIRGDNGFRLGLQMARLGNCSLQTHRLTGVVESPADDLASETETTAHVAVKEGNKLVWLYCSSSSEEDLPMAVGKEAPIHCCAYGQAILANMPLDKVSDLVDDVGLPAVTSETLTDRDKLAERLDTVLDLSFAYSGQEYTEGYSSIAAPIIDPNGQITGSIGITAPHNQIDNPYKRPKARRFSDKLSDRVRRAARSASDRLADR